MSDVIVGCLLTFILSFLLFATAMDSMLEKKAKANLCPIIINGEYEWMSK